jgi:hypothetical protein
MSSALMERTGMAVPGMGVPGMVSPSAVPAGVSYQMVPRCTFKVERCQDGMKVTCTCDDQLACSTMQNLCSVLAGGMCSCYCTYNGVTVCTYNFTMGTCKWEMIPQGCAFTCTSGDAKCCSMIQSYCDCLNAMLNAGCHCCWFVNNTPLCWGSGEPAPTKTSGKR